MKLNVGVIFGSRTCEHDVSIISGLQAAHSLDKSNYDVTVIYIARDGKWYVGDKLNNTAFYQAFDAEKVTQVIPAGEGGKLILRKHDEKRKLFGAPDKPISIDVVLPVMHGMNGEDGTLQGMLELFNVPYACSGVLGSSVGMDKIAMKLLFKGLGLPVIEGMWFDRSRWSEQRDVLMDEAEASIGYPMFVKPANLGSSIGITRADDRETLEEGIDTACAYDKRILIEKGIVDLKEVNCGVLGYAGDITTSALEMPITGGKLLDYEGKYLRGGKTSEGMKSLARIIPAPIPESVAERIREISIAAFRAMDLNGVVRIDFILDKDENVFINEVNTIPGSLAFYLFKPIGMEFSDMLNKMIELAYRAYADKNSSVFSFDSSILSSIINGTKGKLTN